MAHRDMSNMKGWTNIGGDINWQDYGGRWGKKGPDGAWYVLKFDNMYEVMGEKDAMATNTQQYSCEVVYCKLEDIREREAVNALECCGQNGLIERYDIDNSWRYLGKRPGPEVNELLLLSCLIDYGIGGILERFTSATASWGTRNKARKYAEEIMKDEAELEDRLDRQANAIGNSVRDFARGQIGFNG